MKLVTLLPLVTYPDAASEVTVENGVSFSRLLGAELNALALQVDIPPVSNALSRALLDLPEMIEDATRASVETGANLLGVAKARAGDVAVRTFETKSQPALVGEVAAEHARYFDLLLVGLEPEKAPTRMVAEAAIFGSGRPTLLMPSVPMAGKLDHVAIAWDGSRAAARAVADARLLLGRASAVTVITVTDEKPLKEMHAGERLAERLQASGLSARFEAVQAEDCPIAETLQGQAQELGADVLVMGGYGHSRLREFVLGGATDGVLHDLRMPVLLSH
jgi:nucleotide-binding universal stress UspA family protein